MYLEKETGFKFNIVKLKLNISNSVFISMLYVGWGKQLALEFGLHCELDNIVCDCRHRRHISFIVVRKRRG